MPLTRQDALNLASPTKTVPQWEGISPRWLLNLLPWVQVPTGIYRVNRVSRPPQVEAEHLELAEDERVPEGVARYESVRSLRAEPAEAKPDDSVPAVYHLAKVETRVTIPTFVEDMYSHPHDQEAELLRIAVAAIKEEKERRVLQSTKFGLLNVAAPQMRIATRSGTPSPDDLDRLLALVWKKPAFFLAHPRVIAAFGQQCTAAGVTPETVEMFGSPFVTWRGVPLVPSDKLPVDEDDKGAHSSILLLRVGEEEQGVVGLHQADLGDERLQSLRVRRMRIDDDGVLSYLVTCYFGVAVLVDDALGVLEQVRI